MATQIGLSIGETIAACLESRLGNWLVTSSVGPAGNTVIDPSLLNVVIRSEAKEPVGFKRDGRDGHTVHDDGVPEEEGGSSC